MALLGRACFAIAMLAFGIQHLVYGNFVTRLIPGLPAWIPLHTPLAYLAGIGLILASLAIVFGRMARVAAILLAAVILLSFLFLYVPQLVTGPLLGGQWTKAGKALAMAGGAILVAASLGSGTHPSLARFVPVARIFLSAFLLVGGIQHFLFAAFVATLVPPWIPAHMFWTYFAGVALIAGGLGIAIPQTAKPAGLLTALMVFIWVLVLHIPRALAAPHDANETTAVFEALAVSATALLAALMAQSKSSV